MKRNRVKKLEESISRDTHNNLIVLWDGLNEPFTYKDKSYNTKEQLQKEYPNVEFDYITIVWAGEINLKHQTDERVINTLIDFEDNY
jgi:hypothetical protein